MEWVVPGSAELWQSALIGVPIALACGIFSRLLPLRPATRHTLWVAALLGFVLPIVLPSAASLDVASHLPDFATIDPIGGALTRADRDEAAVEDVLDDPGDSDESIFASDSSLPLDAGHAPETASALRGDAPAAMESAHEAEPPSTPRVVLGADAIRTESRSAESRPQLRRTRSRNEPVLTRAESANDAGLHTTESPTAFGSDSGAGDVASEIRTPVVTGFLTDAPSRRSDQRDETSAINFGDIGTIIQGWLVSLSGWLTALGAIVVTALRGMARLPAIPASAWLAGIGVVALVQLIRLWRFRRRLARALPAPSVVRRAVEDVSKEIGLSKAPETLLIDARISPLVWWGRAPTLVIPSRLWAQLDKHGRRAILCHELAHLRRRDHWIIWVEQAVGLAYWWNPLVWWVRKRIQEEADLACDAWVTWLMPRDRRAYAEALLRTRQFLNSDRADVPVGGMAAASGRARDFARRITMVMTKSERPRRSMTGFVLAAAVVSLGWMTSPAWSCPDGDKAKSKKATMKPAVKCEAATECKDASGAKTLIAVPSGQGGVTCTTADGATVLSVPANGLTTTVVGGQGGVSAIAPLTTTTDNVGVRFYTPGSNTVNLRPGQGLGAYGGAVTVPALPYSGTVYSMGGQAASPFVAYTVAQQDGDNDADLEKRLAKIEEEIKKLSQDLKGDRAGRRARSGLTPVTPVAPVAPRAAQSGRADAAASGAVVIKDYALPSGKLDALYNFLVRDDVPIRVRKDGDKLEVHASEAQHEIFKAFLNMVNPEGAKSGMRSPERSARRALALAEDGAVKRQVEEALAKLNSGDVQKSMRDALAARELLLTREARAMKPHIAERLRALTEHAHSHVHARQTEIEAIQQQAESLAQQAEQLTQQAAEMIAAAEAAASDAAAGSEKALEARKREVERSARQLEKRGRELQKQAEKLERKKSEAESRNEESNSMLEELAELASAIESPDELAAIEHDEMDEMIDEVADEAADAASESIDMIEIPDIEVPEIEAPEIDIPAPPTTPAIVPASAAPPTIVAPSSTTPTPTESVRR